MELKIIIKKKIYIVDYNCNIQLLFFQIKVYFLTLQYVIHFSPVAGLEMLPGATFGDGDAHLLLLEGTREIKYPWWT